jgi:hypothetical protein
MGNTAERLEQISPEQQTLNLLFVGRTRRMTQDAASGGMHDAVRVKDRSTCEFRGATEAVSKETDFSYGA